MNKITTAVIMAAGLGTRFGRQTENIPKGFIEAGGKPMVVRSVETLLSCGISRIIIGTGYRKESYEALGERFPQVECVFSPRYAQTNSMFTLYNMRNAIGDDDFMLLESDLVYERKAITALMNCEYASAMLITPVTKFQDQYYVEMDTDSVLVNCSTDKNAINQDGELVGIHRIGNDFFKVMCDDYGAKVEGQPKLGYEYELLHVSRNIKPMNVLKVDGLLWYEIDDEADLEYAEKHILGKIEVGTLP